MVAKIGGVWTMHCPTEEQEHLIRFFEKIKGTDDREEFSKMQHEIIMKACYQPRIIKFAEYGKEPEPDQDEKEIYEEIEFYKENFLKLLSFNVNAAYREGVISKGEKDEFDNYVQTLFGY